ncbi:DMT family transporter [Trinickia soli]|uniref:EamA family transporter n=1 Tax=Trinickia soli TaxID=380675 RepID=A0A2N7VMQ2_9BURK|nr:DMT family transporter [Trinickia soli]KAA0082165.1 DMT family transporter [Paraburkholderia sp. T12-10]PMS18443.1 EamA family transporter [Trinickia soli]CAB3655503.1 Inner membrane protein YtfF [Trinickia soli]
MRRGVTYGVMAGAIWGTVFLVPRLLPDFPPMMLGAARCMMYGLVSLAVALPMARRLAAKLTRADLAAIGTLALVGNLVYYVLLTAGVHRVGIGPTSLVVGVLPVTVTLAGRRDAGAVALDRLLWPLLLVVAGLVCINVDVFAPGPIETGATGVIDKLVGLLCAAGALASWTWFAVENARYLRRHPRFDGNEWSVLLGLATGVLGAVLWLACPLLPSAMSATLTAPSTPLPDARWHAFWLLNLGLAVGASWLGTALWNAASKRLPLTLSGQLIVFETLFALLYGFIYEARLPRPLEAAAIVLLLAGVTWSVRRHDDGARGPATIDGCANTPAP